MINIHSMTEKEFNSLPLVTEGESKIIRDAGDGLAVIKLKPTIYSFTSNRAGVIPGSELLRLRAVACFTKLLNEERIPNTYIDVSDKFILSYLVESPPPIEVIVKAFHTGTPKHQYYGMSGSRVRKGSLYHGTSIEDEGAYPTPIVRFDWRNPLTHPTTGISLSDEALCDDQAELFIDVRKAKRTALQAFQVLSEFLMDRDIVLYDICFFITEDGKTLFGEISQDCGRFRHFDKDSLDKDVWRHGGSSSLVMNKWKRLLELIE